MCQWFSCVSDGSGKIYYFNEAQRKVVCDGGELECINGANSITDRSELDSHSAICAFFGLDCDAVNKYEFRPLDRHWQVDQINTQGFGLGFGQGFGTDDAIKCERKVRRLNMQDLAPPELILKPIIHPFKDRKRKRIVAKDIELLRQWDLVRASVRASVWASVGGSVGGSVGTSVEDLAGASVRTSVWASVRAYASSFFNLPEWKYIRHAKGKNPFQSVIDLWERGIVASYDGKVWRLHGFKGKVLKTITL